LFISIENIETAGTTTISCNTSACKTRGDLHYQRHSRLRGANVDHTGNLWRSSHGGGNFLSTTCRQWNPVAFIDYWEFNIFYQRIQFSAYSPALWCMSDSLIFQWIFHYTVDSKREWRPFSMKEAPMSLRSCFHASMRGISQSLYYFWVDLSGSSGEECYPWWTQSHLWRMASYLSTTMNYFAPGLRGLLLWLCHHYH